jgi:hypothetical protein
MSFSPLCWVFFGVFALSLHFVCQSALATPRTGSAAAAARTLATPVPLLVLVLVLRLRLLRLHLRQRLVL